MQHVAAAGVVVQLAAALIPDALAGAVDGEIDDATGAGDVGLGGGQRVDHADPAARGGPTTTDNGRGTCAAGWFATGAAGASGPGDGACSGPGS